MNTVERRGGTVVRPLQVERESGGVGPVLRTPDTGSRHRSLLVIGPLLLVTLALVPVGGFSAQETAGEQSAAPAQPATTRAKLFDHVWQGVRDRYYDESLHGVPWDALRREYRPRVLEAATLEEAYELLNDMVARLGDAHTRVRTPLDRALREQNQTIAVGLGLADVGDAVLVSRVADQLQASISGVALGARVVALNDVDLTAWLEAAPVRYPSSSVTASRLFAMRTLLLGPPGSQVTAELEAADGQRTRVFLTRSAEDQPTTVTSRREGDVLVIGWNRFRNPVREQVQSILAANADASAVVIDLRDNGGGSLREATELADLFVLGPLPFGRQTARSGQSRLRRIPTYVEPGFGGPVVVVVNGSSASASETFAAALQEAGRATVVGTRTCGCVLVTNGPTSLSGGGELSISEFDYTTPAGRRLEGNGVEPDEHVQVTAADVTVGRDRAMERALAAAQRALEAVPARTEIITQ
jgi:carboxyl-terminal processing protease